MSSLSRDGFVDIRVGDNRTLLGELPENYFHTCVTSPPYFGLRDYGHPDQIGLEETPEKYVRSLVGVFRAVRRVLRDDGTLWLNLGDGYARDAAKGQHRPDQNGVKQSAHNAGAGRAGSLRLVKSHRHHGAHMSHCNQGEYDGVCKYGDEDECPALNGHVGGLKPKDLMMLPARVALALQADGWWLRQDIIWHKINPMPEAVTDRCTRAHEYVFLLSKSERYFFEADAVKEPSVCDRKRGPALHADTKPRNRRSVWPITSQPFKGAHFATMPPSLVEPCVLAGCPEGGNVLDPFGGSGTTGMVARRLHRNVTLLELNPDYAEIARLRCATYRGLHGVSRPVNLCCQTQATTGGPQP